MNIDEKNKNRNQDNAYDTLSNGKKKPLPNRTLTILKYMLNTTKLFHNQIIKKLSFIFIWVEKSKYFPAASNEILILSQHFNDRPQLQYL